jgi:hypothetical protein
VEREPGERKKRKKEERPGRGEKESGKESKRRCMVWEKRPIYIFLPRATHPSNKQPLLSFSHATLHIQIQTHTPVLSTPTLQVSNPSLSLSLHISPLLPTSPNSC